MPSKCIQKKEILTSFWKSSSMLLVVMIAYMKEYLRYVLTLKSWFNESRFNKISRISEQTSAALNYLTIVNSIWFSELHDLVNKSGLFVKSRLGLHLLQLNNYKYWVGIVFQIYPRKRWRNLGSITLKATYPEIMYSICLSLRQNRWNWFSQEDICLG